MKPIFDSTIHEILNERLSRLESHFGADFLFYYGPITDALDKPFRDLIEELKEEPEARTTLFIVLNTPGGSAETVERLVKITRHHYQEVNFIVPDSAYSAGTIFCLSGDKIFMDYSSSLGPIDPQVYNGKNWVPALGYLDKVEELINKSIAGTISQAELIMLREQDLAMLRRHEQARELTVALLKEWLVKYKFKNWNTHRTSGEPVTLAQKETRAMEIARDLGDNKLWHSHGRSIGVSALTNILKLKIEDYSTDRMLSNLIRDYNDLICQYITRNGGEMFFHTRKFI
ncbi:MAG: hypothetical protein JNL17_08415 [Cyclobacteriaceae bacterium]|nr:hypothetical protein [Cyclobacteriaceae bacterium]